MVRRSLRHRCDFPLAPGAFGQLSAYVCFLDDRRVIKFKNEVGEAYQGTNACNNDNT